MEQPIEIFCCAADTDQRYLKKIQQQLIQSVRRGIVTLWDESMIPVGHPRTLEIERHLKGASIFLLLISAEFLASEYCYETVTNAALVRHVAGNATVIPVIVGPADWKTSELRNIQMLPRDLKPINAHDSREQDNLINKIAEEIVNIIRSSPSSRPDPSASSTPTSPVVRVKPLLGTFPFLPPRSGQPPSPLRRIVLLMALVLSIAIIVGGIGVTLYVTQQNQFHAQAIATTQASLTGTAQTQLAGTVQANATLTQQAIQTQANAAATAKATPASVLITSPADGNTVGIVTTVQGTASNIPNGEELWILIVPDGISVYFPQPGPVVITGNKWSSSATIGIPSDHGLGFTLIVALADQNGGATIREYLNQSKQLGSYKGLPLPDGVVPQSQIHVIRK